MIFSKLDNDILYIQMPMTNQKNSHTQFIFLYRYMQGNIWKLCLKSFIVVN